MKSDRTPYLAIASIAIVAAIAFFAGTFLSTVQRQSADAPDVSGFLWPNPPSISDFSLQKDSSEVFSLRDLKDKWSFIFFGFTQCPDVCPTTMQTLKEIKNNLAENRTFQETGQVIFVSVDPERDTPEVLKSYVDYFDESFIGVTGSIDALKSLTTQIGVLFTKIPSGNDDTYTMDHSAGILLVDPAANLVGLFSMPHDSSEISDSFMKIADFLHNN